MDTSISTRPKRNWTTWCPNRRGIAHQNKKWSERYQSWGPIFVENLELSWALTPCLSSFYFTSPFFFKKLYVFLFLLIISGRHRTRMALSKGYTLILGVVGNDARGKWVSCDPKFAIQDGISWVGGGRFESTWAQLQCCACALCGYRIGYWPTTKEFHYMHLIKSGPFINFSVLTNFYE